MTPETRPSRRFILFAIVAALFAAAFAPAFAQEQNCYGTDPVRCMPVDYPTKFSNVGTVGNTRHNLTQRPASGGGPSAVMMDSYRNDYGEVCVYCHTPHGANAAASAPLWNRVLPSAGSFTTYTSLSSGNPVGQPGASSLPCLSCHDGQQSVDAVLNMPGSGRYSSSPSGTFLSTWTNASGLSPPQDGHMALNEAGCLACHSGTTHSAVSSGATDFRAFAVGTDLRNDHPIGVRFPGGTPDTTGFRTGTVSAAGGRVVYYDADANGSFSKGDPRFYDAGGGPMVECASCHDPHGVAASAATPFNPTFLRVSNAGSALCLTCHAK